MSQTPSPSGTIQLRQELEWSRQQQQGKNYLVVKDPVTRRYFRFKETQIVIIEMMRHESLDIEALAVRVSETLQVRVPTVTIAAFYASLEAKYLVDTPAIREKLATIRTHKLEDRNLLYWKLGSINPRKIFEWLLPRTRWAFSRAFNLLALVLIAAGIVISYSHWDQLTASAPSLISISGAVLVWVVMFAVITIHEFSHGLTCRHFGGEVHEVGFMLIYFTPAFYCDVSDSWMFTSRRDRMWVTLAGGYAQMIIWAMCTLIWRITDTDTFINQIALVVILFAGVQSLVNFNPLIKLDGYYLLSDYLEIPNLRAKALSTLWSRLAGKPADAPRREVRTHVIYALLAIAFSTSLLAYVYSTLYTWATTSYALAGLVGFLMFSTFTLRKAASDLISGIRALASRASLRRYRVAVVAVIVLLIAFVARWELKIPAEFRVIAHSESTVRAATEGIVVDMKIREGAIVRKGDILARLRDFDKQQQINEVSGDLQQKRSELSRMVAGARPEEIDRKEKLIETKQVELSNTRRTQEQSNRLRQTLEGKRYELRLDEENSKRNAELFAKGLIPRAELEKTETALKVREREIAETEAAIRVVSETGDREAGLKAGELAEAQSELRLMMAGNRPEQIRETQAEVDKLESQLELLTEELAKTEIRAPIDGIVATPFVERKLNQHLAAGDEFCRIVDTRWVTVEMQVPEKELADVKPGNPVWMKMRSFPSSDFEGRVDFIAPVAQTVAGQQMVVVRSELDNESLLLKPEMTGVAKIYCGDRRIIDLATRRLHRWVRTEFWDLLP